MKIKELAEHYQHGCIVTDEHGHASKLANAVLLLLEDGERLAKLAEQFISWDYITLEDMGKYRTALNSALARHKQTVEGLG